MPGAWVSAMQGVEQKIRVAFEALRTKGQTHSLNWEWVRKFLEECGTRDSEQQSSAWWLLSFKKSLNDRTISLTCCRFCSHLLARQFVRKNPLPLSKRRLSSWWLWNWKKLARLSKYKRSTTSVQDKTYQVQERILESTNHNTRLLPTGNNKAVLA